MYLSIHLAGHTRDVGTISLSRESESIESRDLAILLVEDWQSAIS